MINLFVILVSFLSSVSFAKEPTLKIIAQNTIEMKRSELLNHNDLELLKIDYAPAYNGRQMEFKAVPLYKLFKGVVMRKQGMIQFEALDGYSAPIDRDRILNSSRERSIAYLAIEDPKNKWPRVKDGVPTAGPFYLIWSNPNLSKISQSEWPFMLNAFREVGTFEEIYPKIIPRSKQKTLQLGLNVFIRNCFACHTMNKQGYANFGPDLNIPYSPTEYLKLEYLKKLIRDPQSLRLWKQSRMIGFNKQQISNKELAALIRYFQHMAKNKVSE